MGDAVFGGCELTILSILCNPGSFAENYAVENGLAYEFIG
jgi:hypothetical protein